MIDDLELVGAVQRVPLGRVGGEQPATQHPDVEHAPQILVPPGAVEHLGERRAVRRRMS